mmetsp:Transcript_2142/g.6536  ORF Transcript_2142/g.6536 Transcript_2142/m.6536 type:complete len:367 (+) Transcript_2142:102-1202(+)
MAETPPVPPATAQQPAPPAPAAAPPAPAPAPAAAADEEMEFRTNFQGKPLVLRVRASGCVADLKAAIQDETAVPAKRQKLIGLVKGQLPPDDRPLAGLVGPRGGVPEKFVLMGTPDHLLFVDPADRDDLPEVLDDMDFSDADYFDLAADWHRSQRNEKLLREFTAKTEINWITPRREGKACLVLDLDHTILDFSRIQDGPTALDAVRRPHLQAFLARAYQHYDLVVWSQTSWRWLEVKLTSLGLLSNAAYKFCFVLDKSSMFRIVSKKKDGSEFRHSVKPLQLIWTKCEGWDASNTVHVDDLSRNFALNPKSGIKCRAYHRDKADAGQDTELLGLARYLAKIAAAPATFDHGDWRKVAKSLREGGG